MALPADQLSRVPLLKTPRHVTCGEPGSIYRHQRGLNPKAGLITRRTADDDRRSIEIAVIDDGRAALLAAIESHLQLVATLSAIA
jgi:hypothetical protein